ncbi:hypothetical protein PVT67_07670 [Gallaecimonas kandeliae]|uniref:hypothetical protein n=1 Tax=Gallaecimonas kandeliae TaxID=3029055 RepID=UPI00264877DC|nr:hypothetical protein [Gallaecimonas kandeliae]WKE67103.1 hypothetical protein PVT67_07670 [Gallaecimonas kandeliae]
MQKIIDAIKLSGLKEVYFGANGFSIADENSINDLQLGFSLHPDGTDLTGSNEGDWKKGWIVIGTDTVVGDPFFVDTNQPLLPVYTSMHGMGEWSAELVSASLPSFLETLSYLSCLSKQESARIDPDENTITDTKELSAIEKKLNEISGEKCYWKNFIEQHKEWVEEFNS